MAEQETAGKKPAWFLQIRYIVMAFTLVIGGLVYGYKELVKAGIWVPKAHIEREYDRLAREHVNMKADIITVDATAIVKIFPDKALYLTRAYTMPNGGFAYRGCWVPADPPKASAKRTNFSISPSAHAVEGPPVILCPLVKYPLQHTDTVVENLDDGKQRVKRTFTENNCVVEIIINTVTGALIKGGACVCPWD